MNYKNLAVLAVLVALVLAVTSLWDDSFIVDEIPHVGAGYSYITKGDMRLNPEHPPLAKDLAGLALSLFPINQSVFSTKYWTEDVNGQWNFGRALIFNPTNNVNAITKAAKTTMLIFFVLSAWLIFRWAKELYGGQKASLLALFLFAFSPTVIAHSRFVTTDVPALFGILLGAYFFVKFLEKPTAGRFWLAVLAFGIAQLTKFSVVLLAPLFVLMVLGWCVANSFSFTRSAILFIRSLVLMALGIILVVWPVYALHTMNYPPEKQRTDTEEYLASYGNRMFADPVVWASDKPVIRALAQYATGILMVNQRSVGGNTTFFLGEVRNYAWKHYFPVVYAIKEPLSFWVLAIIAALFAAARFRPANLVFKKAKKILKDHFTEFSMLLWLAIYWYLSIRANLNIGVRHLLPTYGFIFILVSGQIVGLGKLIWNRYGNRAHIFYDVIIYGLSGWYLLSNLSVYPHYLTYFNQLAGGPAGGHQYVVDSNLDWGQDLKRLTMWVEDNDVDKIHLDYFGWADQKYYLKDKLVWIGAGTYKDARDFLSQNPNGGYVAVSASFYMGTRGDAKENYLWLDAYEPIAKIGNSIWIWEIRP